MRGAVRRESHDLRRLVPAILLRLHRELSFHAGLLFLMANGSELSQLLESLLLVLLAIAFSSVCGRLLRRVVL